MQVIDLNKIVENAVVNTPDVNCDEVDIEELEEAGLNVAEKVQDMVVNIDLMNVLFAFLDIINIII